MTHFLTCRIDLLSLLWDCLYLLVRTTVNHLNILMDTVITAASLLSQSISLHPQTHAGWLTINRKRGGFCNVFITLLIISRLNYIMSYSIHLIYLYDFFILYLTLKSLQNLLSIPLICFWSIASIYYQYISWLISCYSSRC